MGVEIQPGQRAAWPPAIAAGLAPASEEALAALCPTSPRLGVVTALQAEADCLGPRRDSAAALTFVSGGNARRARLGAEELIAKGVAGLVSFGVATGLAPVVRPGDLVIADSVVMMPSGETFATDAGWRAALLARLGGIGGTLRVARIAGCDELLTSTGAKRRAFQATFAAALDTESHVLAEAAAAAGVPLLVVRAVAEPAEEMRPAVAFAATTPDGQSRGLAVVGHLARHPWDIPAAWRFTRHGRLALETLRRVAAAGPDPFAFTPG